MHRWFVKQQLCRAHAIAGYKRRSNQAVLIIRLEIIRAKVLIAIYVLIRHKFDIIQIKFQVFFPVWKSKEI